MIDLHRRRSSSLTLACVFALSLCAQSAFAADSGSSDETKDAAATTPAKDAQLSPETEGDLLMIHRSYAAAIDAYRRETNQSAALWNKIGVAYHHMFALDEARKYYQMALHLNPHYADALNNLAAVYHGQHDYAHAERTYKQALKITPQAAVLYCNLGTSYFAEAKYKAGMEAYNKALTLNPHIFDPGQIQIVEETTSRRQLVAVNYYLAKTYASAGHYEQAVGYLRRALEAGFRDEKQLMKDKEFASLRATPEFQELMARQHGGQ